MQAEQTTRARWSGREWALATLLLLLVVVSSFATLDRHAEADYEALFQRAFITFALARTLNGVISVVQGTEVALQPAGVGVTLTPGEILDPVNDLVERFSWIMLGATLSLGIQQVLMDIGQWWFMRALVALAGILWLWARVSKATTGTEQTLLKVFVIVLFLRFAVPVALMGNELLFELFLEPRYLESTQVIETAGAEIEQIGTEGLDEDETEPTSLMESLERALDSTRETLDLKHRVEYIKQRTGDVIEHLIQLSVVFILQTAVLPIAFLWLFLQLLKQLFRPSQPVPAT